VILTRALLPNECASFQPFWANVVSDERLHGLSPFMPEATTSGRFTRKARVNLAISERSAKSRAKTGLPDGSEGDLNPETLRFHSPAAGGSSGEAISWLCCSIGRRHASFLQHL